MEKVKEFDLIIEEIINSNEDQYIKDQSMMLLNYTQDLYSGSFYNFNKKIFISGQKAYKKMNVISDTLIFQEFLIPSEVICVCASNQKNWGNQLLNKYL